MKKIYFLSGLPRSGSTVLAAILSQNPSIHATSTSNLLDTLVGTLRAWADSLTTRAQTDQKKEEEKIQNVLNNICKTQYDDNCDLVAVAKLPQPIKSEPDIPVNFIIRFDT